MIENNHQMSDKFNVFIESSNFSRNRENLFIGNTVMISFTKVNVYIKGPVIFLNNGITDSEIYKTFSVINFHSCDITFIDAITFDKNTCQQVILLDTYIKVMEHANITFVNNIYVNEVVVVESAKEFNQPHPFCLFQYIAIIILTLQQKICKLITSSYLVIIDLFVMS